MPKLKYFEGVRAARARSEASGDPAGPFDFTSIGSTGFGARVKAVLFQKLMGPTYGLLRRFFPIVKLAGFTHISRDEQVRDVLSRPEEFCVPFGPEMEELAGGATFVLGLDGPAQARQNAIIREMIHPGPDIALITDLTHRFAGALLQNSGGKIDAMNDLIKRTATEVCIRYFGFIVDDPDQFGDWTISASALLFADPFGDPKVRDLALKGAVRLRAAIDDSVRRTKRSIGPDTDPASANLVERIILIQRARAASDPVTDAEVRAILYGLVTGFIPTNGLAAGKMLEVFVQRPEAYAMAVAAAKQGEAGREAMRRIVLEAGRLNPALSPGQWRYCPKAAEIKVGDQTRTIEAGSLLMVGTMSAMRDKRVIPEPGRFWPDRTDSAGKWVEPDLIFGDGVHQCLGKYLAIEQISALFMTLFAQPNLRPSRGKAGRMASIGPFPRHLQMTFDTPASQQSMFLVIAPVTSGKSKADIDAMLAPFGNPAGQAFRAALDATGVVHFCSLATIETEGRVDLVWELSVDGSEGDALDKIASAAGALLRPVYAECGLAEAQEIAAFWKRHIVHLHGKPWGANGLNYNGLPEFSVAECARQARLAAFVERVVGDHMASEAQRGSHAMLALNHVRRIIGQDRILWRKGTAAQRALMEEAKAEGYDALSLKPGAATLQLADFKPLRWTESLFAFLGSREGLIFTLPATVVFALFFWMFITGDPSPGYLWRWIGTGLRALLATTLVLGGLLTAFFIAIRRAEKSDEIDRSQAPLSHVEALAAQEDAPGHVQNHILAVGEMKTGWLRAFAHAFALWAIRIIIVFNYRPGFVINMGTIHYARWWRVPGTNKTAFYSNFDGSWQSYLEDFITRARWGQTAAWSNWKGFPETRYLVFKGAELGDDFKRWVRTRQQIVPVWYNRFPTLTTDRIRTNALIHQGLAHARTNSEAEEWLRCLGSMPRVANLIESDEVQALVFTGLKQLPHCATLVVRLPQGRMLGEWLSWVRGERQELDRQGEAGAGAATGGLSDGGVILPVTSETGEIEGYALAHSLTITFGDRPLVADVSFGGATPAPLDATDTPADPARFGLADASRVGRRAVFLGLSANGVAQLSPDTTALDGLPSAFRMGMAKRGRALGDWGRDSADGWRWSDTGSDAVLILYAETQADLAFISQVHSALIENYGGKLLHQLDCAPVDPEKPDFEHFGYRDGISQPVVKGTGRATRGVPDRDLIEPGEFLLGYANGSGLHSPSPLLPAEADPARALPVLSPEMLSRYPDFGDARFGDAPRDLGRNGSFIVIRELAQDVDGFEAFTEAKAAELRGVGGGGGDAAYRDLYKLIGQYPDKDWVKAKLMGRWPNGRPMIGNPVSIPSPAPGHPDAAKALAAETENDFSFGADDPQGYACPFASHIRRTNPRDSKQPGDMKEQDISNRHRLLRRGRTYTRTGADGAVEKGLLFVSLCADLERQFEFVQQIWSNAGSFHGLSGEPDPIVGSDTPDPATGCPMERSFTIPTPAGPLKLTGLKNFVQVKAGGYFFMPSRSALTWMTETALAQPDAPQ